MATGNRKRSATGKKSSSGRKTNSGHKRNTKKQQEREAEFTREVILWIVVAVSLLLFISNFGFGGTIGGTVSRFFFGLFGIISYIFPIVLLVGTFFAVSNQGNRVAAVKLVAVILFVAFLCMFFEKWRRADRRRTFPYVMLRIWSDRGICDRCDRTHYLACTHHGAICISWHAKRWAQGV